MKISILKLVMVILFCTYSISALWAQTPEKISYQAVIRNSSDQLVADQSIGMQISILQGTVDGTEVYIETQNPTTNTNGLVSIEIGTGTVQDGDLAIIDWSNGPYFIKTEIDPAGEDAYTITGTSQVLSVPYALYAKTAENVTNDLVDDADADPANEMNTGVVLNGTDLEVTDGNGTIVTDLSSLQDGVNDADIDITNEIQNIEQVLTFGNDANGIDLVNTGKIGVGTAMPNAESSIEVSTALPIIFPSMTQAQIDALSNPVVGMVQYNTTDNKLQVYTTEEVIIIDPASNQTGIGNGWYIDKDYDGTSYIDSKLGQSFIPTLSGILTKVSLRIRYNVANTDSQVMRVEIYSGSDMTSSPILLASESFILTSTSFSWYDITLAANPIVTAGNDYIIVCKYDDPCDVTGYNSAEWERNVGEYLTYPRNWSDYGFGGSCTITPTWTNSSNDNRYIHKLWISSMVNFWKDLH